MPLPRLAWIAITCGWAAVASADGETSGQKEGQTCIDCNRGNTSSDSSSSNSSSSSSSDSGGGGDDSSNTNTFDNPRSHWRPKSEREGAQPEPSPPSVEPTPEPPPDPGPPPAADTFGVFRHVSSFDGGPPLDWSFETSTAWSDQLRTNPRLFAQTQIKDQFIRMAPDRRVEHNLKKIDRHFSKVEHMMETVFGPASGPGDGDRAAADLFGNLVDDDDAEMPPADAPLPLFWQCLDKWLAAP